MTMRSMNNMTTTSMKTNKNNAPSKVHFSLCFLCLYIDLRIVKLDILPIILILPANLPNFYILLINV